MSDSHFSAVRAFHAATGAAAESAQAAAVTHIPKTAAHHADGRRFFVPNSSGLCSGGNANRGMRYLSLPIAARCCLTISPIAGSSARKVGWGSYNTEEVG